MLADEHAATHSSRTISRVAPLFATDGRWTANLRILEIAEVMTVPHMPQSHPFVERLIGTMRREFLDHVLFWNAILNGSSLTSRTTTTRSGARIIEGYTIELWR
jgi:hypothetical protein